VSVYRLRSRAAAVAWANANNVRLADADLSGSTCASHVPAGAPPAGPQGASPVSPVQIELAVK